MSNFRQLVGVVYSGKRTAAYSVPSGGNIRTKEKRADAYQVDKAHSYKPEGKRHVGQRIQIEGVYVPPIQVSFSQQYIEITEIVKKDLIVSQQYVEISEVVKKDLFVSQQYIEISETESAHVPLSIRNTSTNIRSIGVTTTNIAYPSTFDAGNEFILHVYHQSALTTPAGWTVAGAVGPIDVDGTIVTVLRTTATGSETGSLTLTQAVSGRLIACMCVVVGTIASVNTTNNVLSSTTPNFLTPSANLSDQGVIFAAVGISTGTDSATWTPITSGFALRSSNTISTNMMAVASYYTETNSASFTNVEFEFSLPGSTAVGTIVTEII